MEHKSILAILIVFFLCVVSLLGAAYGARQISIERARQISVHHVSIRFPYVYISLYIADKILKVVVVVSVFSIESSTFLCFAAPT